MATKKAATKAAKKATARAKSAKVWKMTIDDNGHFAEDPLDQVNVGDHVKITIPKEKSATIKVAITMAPRGGGGGPIVITS
jgi:nitrate/nitrite-specific signal transduction histidine kinase